MDEARYTIAATACAAFPCFLRHRSKIKAELAKVGSDSPRPNLPLRRPRALTLPLRPPENAGVERDRQTARDQLQSKFFNKLPFDVRRLIYQEVLGDSKVQLIQLNGQWVHGVCWKGTEGLACWWEKGRWVQPPDSLGYWFSGLVKSPHAERGFIPLLRTCRRLYSEAVDVLYSDNTFELPDPRDLISFSNGILPQRLDSIRSLRLHKWRYRMRPYKRYGIPNSITWDVVCRTLASMKGLVHLSIRLNQGAWYADDGTEASLLEMLNMVEKPKEIMVQLSQQLEESLDPSWEVVSHSPLKVRRTRGRNYATRFASSPTASVSEESRTGDL